jgi:hypothetical protein
VQRITSPFGWAQVKGINQASVTLLLVHQSLHPELLGKNTLLN